MLRLLKFPFFIVLIGYSISCNCEEPEIPDPDNGEVIQSITYSNSNQSQTHTMTYDNYGKLIAIDGISNSRKMEFSYDSLGRLIRVFIFKESDKLIFKDSLSYNNQGQIDKICVYIVNSKGSINLNSIYYYYYDISGMVMSRKAFSPINGDTSSIEKYFWLKGNIQKREFYNGDGDLWYVFIYEYDEYKNFKKDFPFYYHDPMDWTENNITWDGFNDYYGNLDRFRNPFTYEYLYNSSDLPYQMKSNWDYSWTIDYE